MDRCLHVARNNAFLDKKPILGASASSLELLALSLSSADPLLIGLHFGTWTQPLCPETTRKKTKPGLSSE